jgi:D-hydroxyproline dehydrogenase subunit alpha
VQRTDVAIVGSGPAGLAAAAEAAAAGARVTLIDEYLRLGGQFFKHLPAGFAVEDASALGKDYARGQQLMSLVTSANVDVWLNTLIWGAFDDRTLALMRGHDNVELRAEKVIVATGAYDKPVPFPGWTLPGVMTAGAAQTLVKSQAILPGSRVLLVGTGPFQLPVAHQLLHGGAKLAGVVEATSFGSLVRGAPGAAGRLDRALEGFGYWREIRASGAPFIFGHTIVEARGDDRVREAVIAAIDDDWKIKPGSERVFAVDALCLAFGFLPSTQITRLLGCDERFDLEAGGFLPKHDANLETSVPGVFVAGEVGGIGGSDAALAEGRLAALAAVRQLGLVDQAAAESRLAGLRVEVQKTRRFADYLSRSFSPKPAAFERIPDDTIICRCEEVTAGDVRRAVLEGARSLKTIKILTRAGMGLCQGRICGSVVGQLASLASGRPIESFGSATVRPPIKPVRLGDLARGAQQ